MQKKTERNSILEFERLLAALWVLFYHRFEDILHGYLAVEFFFALSGLFFIATFKKENDKGFFKGLLSYNCKRIKPILFTLMLCLPFTINRIISIGDLGYLWFIPYLLATLSFFFILRRLIKSEKLFLIITSILTIVCLGLISSGVTYDHIFRAVGMIGLGICIYFIPRLPGRKLSQGISIAWWITAIVSIILLEFFCKTTTIFHPVYFLLIVPSLLYFSNQITFKNRIINKISSINFGVYAYQEIVRYISIFVSFNPFVYCTIVVAFAIVFEFIEILTIKLFKKCIPTIKAPL